MNRSRASLWHASRFWAQSGRLRKFSSLSDVLSQVASDSCCRKNLLEQVRTLGRIITRPGWDPNSRTSIGPGTTVPQLTADHVTELIRAIRHDPIWALRVYIWATRQANYAHTSCTTSLILELWSDTHHMKPFLNVLQDPSRPSSSDDYLLLIMKPFLNVLQDPSRPSSSDDYLLLIKGYGWARMPDLAMTTLDRMINAGIEPGISHFNSLLYILVNENRLKNIREVFKLMQENSVTPNKSTYALRVRGYCVAGQFDEAHKAFRQMLKAGVPPDIRTFGYLMDAMCKANKPYLMYVLPVDLNDHGFVPDVSILYEMLEALCRNNCVKYAEKLMNKIKKRNVEPDAHICDILTKGFCREGKWQSAYVQVKETLKRGFLPAPDVFDLVLILLFKHGRIGNIFKLFDRLVNKDFLPNTSTYDSLIYGLCKCEEVGKAFEAWNISLNFNLLTVRTYRALIQGLCKTGMLAEAKEVFITSMESGFVGDDRAHDALLYRLKQAGRVNDAKECEDILAARKKANDDTIDIFEDISPVSSDSEFYAESCASDEDMNSSSTDEEDMTDNDY
ncbi:hypothetical protein KP509_13G059700 [Ceratopteris richardii]|uniref:PROP1-like PPR domain-containing protein n=2 Tax=Ceratopteris richardii TaxID=49495 RepID=A0A8T2TDW6_CERRI|nr:hypothetical protein KP509_13G059700 [Ceratopteris richardii]